jgi:hypothetical protein
MNLNNEQGITLVELLATIVITAMIGIIASTILFSGFQTYDRVNVEAELRDEADLIMAEVINELFTLKLSDVDNVYFPVGGSSDYFIEMTDGEKIGFINGKVILRNREVPIVNHMIELTEDTKIAEVTEGQYRITLVLIEENSGRKIELESEIGVINDIKEE